MERDKYKRKRKRSTGQGTGQGQYLHFIVILQRGQACSVAEVPDLDAPVSGPRDQLPAPGGQCHGRDLRVAVAGELNQSLPCGHIPHIHHRVMAAAYHLGNTFYTLLCKCLY